MSSAVSASKPMSSSAILTTIASLEKQLSALKVSLGEGGKKAKDPDAPKKEANVWIKFTQRVGPLIKEQLAAKKAPATIGKQFCSFLKEQKAYDLWEDEEILAEFETWEAPEVSKMEAAGKTKKKSPSASEAEAESDSKSEKKARKPQSEETKAKAALKRAATKAAKAAAAVAVDEDPVDEEDPMPLSAYTPVPAAIAALEADPTELEDDSFSATTVVKTKVVAKPAPKLVAKPAKTEAPKPAFTMEQLMDFDSFTYEGADYGRNVRGDVINGDGAYVGHWTGKTLKLSKTAPADWEDIQAAM